MPKSTTIVGKKQTFVTVNSRAAGALWQSPWKARCGATATKETLHGRLARLTECAVAYAKDLRKLDRRELKLAEREKAALEKREELRIKDRRPSARTWTCGRAAPRGTEMVRVWGILQCIAMQLFAKHYSGTCWTLRMIPTGKRLAALPRGSTRKNPALPPATRIQDASARPDYQDSERDAASPRPQRSRSWSHNGCFACLHIICRGWCTTRKHCFFEDRQCGPHWHMIPQHCCDNVGGVIGDLWARRV